MYNQQSVFKSNRFKPFLPMFYYVALSIVVLFSSPAIAQDIIETDSAGNDITSSSSFLSTPSILPQAQPRLSRNLHYAFPTVNRNRAQTIAGATIFFSGVALDFAVLSPWASRLNKRILATDTLSEADSEEALLLLLASLPVGMIQIGGASIACAGASRLRGTYLELVDGDIDEVRVWLPYTIGWVGRGVGGVLGFIAGFSKSSELSTVASYFSLAGAIAWTTSTIMSLVYSGKWRAKARDRLSHAPIG